MNTMQQNMQRLMQDMKHGQEKLGNKIELVGIGVEMLEKRKELEDPKVNKDELKYTSVTFTETNQNEYDNESFGNGLIISLNVSSK